MANELAKNGKTITYIINIIYAAEHDSQSIKTQSELNLSRIKALHEKHGWDTLNAKFKINRT